jgi:hypothetical protein
MSEHRIRNRFICSFFILGVIVPIAIMVVGSWIGGTANGGESVSGHTGAGQWFLLWMIWPTWILMSDAEHGANKAFMLTISAALNGIWYAGLCLVVWRVFTGVKSLVRSIPWGSSK